jgi:acyl transferase domain-containing protein
VAVASEYFSRQFIYPLALLEGMETSPSIHGTHVPSTRADEGREPIKIINGVNGISSYANPAEPIAICGIGLRLPGGIRDGKSFWKALYNGVDLRTPIPKSRFNAEGFGLALGSKGGFDVSHGYFLEEDLGAFDASFFTGTRNEYEKIDPQVRKLLEVTRECLENAGEIGYRGKSVGVYVGTFGDDWMVQQLKEGGQYTGGYNFSADILLANRVSYEFDFRGPRYFTRQR